MHEQTALSKTTISRKNTSRCIAYCVMNRAINAVTTCLMKHISNRGIGFNQHDIVAKK